MTALRLALLHLDQVKLILWWAPWKWGTLREVWVALQQQRKLDELRGE